MYHSRAEINTVTFYTVTSTHVHHQKAGIVVI